jgi:hypothetical protein
MPRARSPVRLVNARPALTDSTRAAWHPGPQSRVWLLLWFLMAPLAWSLHLGACYALISVGCRLDWGWMRAAIIGVTIAFAVVSLLSALATLRNWPRPIRILTWLASEEEDTPESNFLLGLGVIATGAFTLAILLGGFGTLALPLCAHAH